MASDDQRQYTIAHDDRSDNSAFTVPGDEDGGAGDDSFPTEINDTIYTRWYVHIENGWNENVDVTVRGSRFDDATMSAAADDGDAVTVNSGTNAAFDGASGHSYLDVNVNPAADPSSGDLVITFQRRRTA